jgi:hypothetical protein
MDRTDDQQVSAPDDLLLYKKCTASSTLLRDIRCMQLPVL